MAISRHPIMMPAVAAQFFVLISLALRPAITPRRMASKPKKIPITEANNIRLGNRPSEFVVQSVARYKKNKIHEIGNAHETINDAHERKSMPRLLIFG